MEIAGERVLDRNTYCTKCSKTTAIENFVVISGSFKSSAVFSSLCAEQRSIFNISINLSDEEVKRGTRIFKSEISIHLTNESFTKYYRYCVV